MPESNKRLQKNLTLFDVYAISTGAMFSSGFFLLPGLATAMAGPSAVLAYLLAGILILPAMFSKAELSTAMPKAGGTYYFLDRSLGPMAGTIGGLGTWLALVFKSAFALIGMGAYLVFFLDLPIKPLAVAFTVAFTLLNIFGAKETSGLQRILVITLLTVLTFFVVQGLFEVFSLGVEQIHEEQFTPFMPFGAENLLGTIGLVFVSYAGLTKVASVAEEVQQPDRNIPLGMALSLATATFVYVVGVYIMIAVLDANELRSDLTPVATAAEAFFDWLPSPFGLLLIVIAAIAAFASTGNAGILSASRYPLAMARDRLVSQRLAKVGRFGTPVPAILVTAVLMIVFILIFDTESVAKLASAFQLLIFMLVNVSVVVMRESRIPGYVPGYRSPWYPWTQIVGVIAPLFLIGEMGMLSIAFTFGIVLVGLAWYYYYVRRNTQVVREGAIYHLFARLGKYRYDPLDAELRGILKEKGLSDEAPFEHLVAHAAIIDRDDADSFEELAVEASAVLAKRLGLSEERIQKGFLEGSAFGATPVSHGAALPHQRLAEIETSHLVMVRCRKGIRLQFETMMHDPDEIVYALFFLVSPEGQPGIHLRILANIASLIDQEQFMARWRHARDEQELKEALLRHERYLSLVLRPGDATAAFIGKTLRELNLPQGNLIALIHRNRQSIVPHGGTELRAG
ncbi:MAG TPA: amino acid permease, partial [Rhodothermales bacterium]|nr:amino acid permease [Rhodothermales bacterium]